MKKVISIIAIIAGGLVLLSVVAPMIIGVILKAKVSGSVAIIGGADGPTTIFLVGALGVGGIIIEIVLGILLIAAGIWILMKSRKK